MDTCPYSLQLSAYHDGELSGERLRQLEQHLESACPACRAEVGQWQRLSALLTSAPAPMLSAQAKQRLYRLAPVVREAGFIRIAEWTTALAASVLLAVSGWMVLNRQGPQPTLTAQTTTEPASLRQFVLSPSSSTDLSIEPRSEPQLDDLLLSSVATGGIND
jgi:anti-sigma factor RsiW